MNKVSISIAQATFNEESNIVRNLEAINNWVDEIIIADEGSTDKTVELAKKFSKIKILPVNHEPIFHITKQKAIDACTSDWILQLDTDEVVTSELKDEIIKTINSNPAENGFWINRSNYFLGKFLTKGGIYPDATIRLYRRGFGHLPCLNVHEQAEVKGTVGHLKSDLLHYSDPTFSRYLIRHDRYTTLLAQDYLHEKLPLNSTTTLNYIFLKPVLWFLSTFIRHKGFVDGFPGFVYSMYSALRFPSSYIKYWEIMNAKNA
jgi:glycosyltransferase involved in cell wall biosynthesis